MFLLLAHPPDRNVPSRWLALDSSGLSFTIRSLCRSYTFSGVPLSI